MIKTIIWVRHGEVNTPQKQYDQLLPNGKEFALRLPGLLRHNSITPDVVYFDESIDHGGGIPRRCKATVEGLDENLKRPFSCSSVPAAQQLLLDLFKTEPRVIVICYKTESFFKFPPITQSEFAPHMGKESKPDKSVYDKLYDLILVTEFDGEELSLTGAIPSDMRKQQS